MRLPVCETAKLLGTISRRTFNDFMLIKHVADKSLFSSKVLRAKSALKTGSCTKSLPVCLYLLWSANVTMDASFHVVPQSALAIMARVAAVGICTLVHF
jgi:hypothetical protein